MIKNFGLVVKHKGKTCVASIKDNELRLQYLMDGVIEYYKKEMVEVDIPVGIVDDMYCVLENSKDLPIIACVNSNKYLGICLVDVELRVFYMDNVDNNLEWGEVIILTEEINMVVRAAYNLMMEIDVFRRTIDLVAF